LALAPLVLATIHPSAVLRAPDAARRGAEMDGLVADLRIVADLTIVAGFVESRRPGAGSGA
jgi:DNA polymerase